MSNPKATAEAEREGGPTNTNPTASAPQPPMIAPLGPADQTVAGIKPNFLAGLPDANAQHAAQLRPSLPDAQSDINTLLGVPPPLPHKPPTQPPKVATQPPTQPGSQVTPSPQRVTNVTQVPESWAVGPAAHATPAPQPSKQPTKPPTHPPGHSQPTPLPAGKEYTAPGGQPQRQVLGPGTRVHHYELIKLIGRGGMGSVYVARDTRLGRKVAIKFLDTQSDDLTKRFILEARTTAACSHENIVVIFEVDAWQGAPFMVFEFINGAPLTKLIPEGKPLPPPRVVELMVPVVRALAFAHSQGIVHRDLKPDNVMVTDSGVTKVLDFGIAKVLQGDEKAPQHVMRPRAPSQTFEDHTTAELTEYGAMMGTLAFMAPEQWGIGVPIDHRADIWAVGIMMFKMLTGKHPLDPFRGQQLMVTGLLNEPMPKLNSKAPEIPAGLAEVVDRCLLKHKDKRWPDAVTLLRALEPFLPGRYSKDLKMDESPYAGLSSFQENDADRFFGRRNEVAAMVNRIRERPIIGVVGPSGAGKSSFVRAGLVPALKRSGEAWESMVVRPGRSPLAALASLISPMVSTSVTVANEIEEEKKLTARLATEPGFVGSVLRARARREKKNILLFVDQFEELYTLVPDPAERKAFTACLAGVADDATAPIRLVLSIRSDFLDRVPEDPQFMAELNQGLVFLASPGIEGLKEAIVMPAELAGYKYESPEIIEDMLKHLATTQGALPLLQFSAQKLWENRDPARKMLTKFAYEAIGGVGGALASHAEAVLAKLPQAKLQVVRSILLRLVTPDRTRAIVSMEELDELSSNKAELRALVDDLVAARLLVVQTGSGVATVEIVHESLLHSWPTLKRWLEETSEDSAFIEQLRNAARAWQNHDRDANLLWRGELADEASRFQRRHKGELAENQKAYLDAVIAFGLKEQRQARAITIGAVVVLAMLLVAAGVALVLIKNARDAADEKAVIAVASENKAIEALEAAQKKEQERAAAQAAAAASEAEARKSAAELRVKQQELIAALDKANEESQKAKAAEGKAVRNASEALDARKRSEEAKKRADQARVEVQGLLAKEKERALRLEEQLGSPVIDTLK